MQDVTIKVIARMKSDFPDKFGIPRQSGLINSLVSTIVFEQEYRNSDALRGLEDFSHLWIIWQFSKAIRETWTPTVRPPRLGGNARMGVFATRSPFRPNAIGLSSAKILGLEHTKEFGTVIHVAGADLMDGTPIFDIKPYLPYSDCHLDATGGFTDNVSKFILSVNISTELIAKVPTEKQKALLDVLSHDPRPSYQNDSQRIYGLTFAGMNIRFRVEDNILTVLEIL